MEKEKKGQPNITIFDDKTKTHYIKGKKLGGGGFGEVYEFIEVNTNKLYAGKIIPLKKIESNPISRISFQNECSLSRDLNFEYICKCHSTFKDEENAYLLLDYYPNKTLNELISQRKTLTEFEVKYYGYQLLLAIEYLHNQHIIHRDLKLSNILLTNKMEIRVCDFGLAIKFGSEGHQTVCGTPNYIAPEVLIKNHISYGFEVDIWSFGIILYTLLYGKTPFEEKGKGRTKSNILSLNYSFPINLDISIEANELIESILVKNPENRPSIKEIKNGEFFNSGKDIPKYLPNSTLTSQLTWRDIENIIKEANEKGDTMDNIDTFNNNNFRNSFYRNHQYYETSEGDTDSREDNIFDNMAKMTLKARDTSNKDAKYKDLENKGLKDHNKKIKEKNNKINSNKGDYEEKYNNNSDSIHNLINENAKKEKYVCFNNIISNQNFTVIEKFFDCSDKYGLCYLLSNGNTGVYFNDSTKMILFKASYYFFYINKENSVFQYSTKVHPKELKDKVNLLELFHKNLIKNVKNKETFEINPLLNPKNLDVFVKKWQKTKYALFFLLSNNAIQVIFNDKTEIHFFLDDKSVFYIDKSRKKLKEKFSPNEFHYKNQEMTQRVLYARKILGSDRH